MRFDMHCGLRWRCHGDETNPCVVLLHPIATDGSVWAAQAASWADRFHVVAIDLPGHGASTQPEAGAGITDFAAAIEVSLREGGVRRAAIVGLSLGSMVAQRLAADYPGLVRSVVLASGAAWTSAEGRDAWDARIADAERAGMESLKEAMLQRWFTPEFLLDEPKAVAEVGDLITATPVAGFIAAARAIAQLDNRDALARITCPALVVAGTSDRATPPSVVGPIADAIRGARYLELPAAHVVNVEAADLFNRDIGQFLDASLAVSA